MSASSDREVADATVAGIVIVLGAPNDDRGELSEIARGRIALGRTIYEARRRAGWKLMLTGGFGAHFNTTAQPHAHFARAAMLAAGVPPGDILDLALSRNTVDDALCARPIVVAAGATALVVVSSDFHLPRVEFVFRRVFPDLAIDFRGAPYLPTCTAAEQARLLAHESRELESLAARGESLVGGALNVDSWR